MLGARRSVAQSVESHVEDALGLVGLGGCDLCDRADHLDDLVEVRVRPRDTGRLGALQQRLAGGVERSATAAEEVGLAIEVGKQLLCEGTLRAELGDEPVQTRDELVPRRQGGELGGRAAQRLYLVDVDGLE